MKTGPVALPPHPARAVTRVYLVLGALMAMLGIVSLAAGGVLGGVLGLCGAAIAVWAWRKIDAQLTGVQLVNLATQEITRGRFEEAERIAALVPKHGMIGALPRAVALQRTLIALARGNPADAVREANAATATGLGLMLRAFKRGQRARGYSLRGLARIGTGEVAEALADADAAEAILEAPPETIARARLVRALAKSKDGKHDEVARMIAADGELLYEHLPPMERSLLRALARMTQRRKRSVYREPAKPIETDAEPNKLAGFIARIAPEAASFADETRPLAARIDAPVPPPPATNEVAQRIAVGRAAAATRAKTKKPVALTVALWLVLVVMFLAIWQFLSPAEPGARHVEESASTFTTALVTFVPLFFVVLLFAIVARQTLSSRGVMKRISKASRMAALGDIAAARAEYMQIVGHAGAAVSATAWLELAKLASADAMFPDAIAACEKAIARLDAQPMVRASVSDVLLPSIIAELAVAKAAAGRIAEADAELATLMRNHPQYALLASAHARVRLVRAVRMGDFDAAAAVARERTAELPMPRREEVVADLLLAAMGPVSEDERERLASELGDARLARWIDEVAPGLRDRALGRVRVGQASEEEHVEEEREEEAKRAMRRSP